jgi:hypothetical protein
MSKGSQPLAWRKRRGFLIIRTYAVTIAGTTDSVRIPPAPLIRGVATAGGIVQSAKTVFSV